MQIWARIRSVFYKDFLTVAYKELCRVYTIPRHQMEIGSMKQNWHGAEGGILRP